MKIIILGLALIALVGCRHMFHKETFVTVGLVNMSDKKLVGTKLSAADRQLFSAGLMSPNAESTHLDYSWSNMPDQAKLSFLDYETRKSYSIEVSLTDVNAHVLSGKCKQVTIRILDYDKAEVACK